MTRYIRLVFVFVLLTSTAHAGIKTEDITYQQNGTTLKGYIAYDDAIKGKRPGVLVVHEWWGHNAFARSRAEALAGLGYTALAVDMYGDGKTADHPDDAGKFAGAVGGNPTLAKARFDAALTKLRSHPTVAGDDIAAIGYCFGGGVVLNMARMGADIDGVVSFHGSVATQTPAKKGDITTRIRVYNGADDPFIKAEQIEAFKQEMDATGADYEFVNYPGAKHSFTNPGATAVGEKFGLPLEYNEKVDKASWQAMQEFFDEIFR